MKLPIEEIFKSPQNRQPIISFDGQHLAFIKSDGNREVIVARNLKTQGDVPIAVLEDSHIMTMGWLYDSQTLYLIKDHHGDENFRLYTIDLKSQQLIAHTPFEGVYVKDVALDSFYPHHICFAMNKDNPQAHDGYKLDLTRGILTKIFENDGNVIQFLYRNLEVGAYTKQDDNGIIHVFVLQNKTWQHIYQWGIDGFFFNQLLLFTPLGDGIYLLEADTCDTTSLSKLIIETGTLELILSDPRYDIDHLVLSADGKSIEAAGRLDTHNTYLPTSEHHKTYQQLKQDLNRDFYILSQSEDGTKIIKVVDPSGRLSYVMLRAGEIEKLFSQNEGLDAYALSEIEPIRLTSRDGLILEGYVTYPLGKRKDVPLVMSVHGGPWGRDVPEYIAKEAMWFSSRGYASITINFRGSTGYGKSFFNAGRYQWGKKMQDDILDGMAWAIEKGITTADNVSIFGMSYGGYAVLAAATLTPDVFCCGVDRVGPSDVVRILEDMPPQWGVFRKAFYHNVGDPKDHKEALQGISPLYHVDNIKMPLLIAQGKNDPRVKVSESENIVAALKEKGLSHEYMLFEDEGHIFVKESNIFAFYDAAELFLDQHHKK